MKYVVEFLARAGLGSVALTRVFRELTRINGGRSRSGVDGGESYDRLLVHMYIRTWPRSSFLQARCERPLTRDSSTEQGPCPRDALDGKVREG